MMSALLLAIVVVVMPSDVTMKVDADPVTARLLSRVATGFRGW